MTGRVDCGPRSWQHALDHATRGRVFASIERIRDLGRVPGPQRTSVIDGSLALKALGVRSERVIGEEWELVDDALREGSGVVLCITYGVLNRLTPWRSGDPRFTGGHSIYVQERRRGPGDRRYRTLSFDSLYDGRRPGIPPGPRWVRLGMLRRAAEAFAGRPGRAWALIVPDSRLRVAGGPGDDVDLEQSWPIEPDDEPLEGVVPVDGSLGEAFGPLELEEPEPDDELLPIEPV